MTGYFIAKPSGYGDSVLVVRSIRGGGRSIEPFRWFPSDRAPVHFFARQFKTLATAEKELSKMATVGGYDDFTIRPIEA